MKRSDITILIVEDDKTFGKVLKESLSKVGFTVHLAHTPVDALNQCRLQSIHLAILDCMLPKMNGIDLAIEMRKTQFGQNPIILMSGIFKEKTFENESLTKSGAISFLKKPFELKELEEICVKSLGALLESESWSLKSLLAKRLRSVRDRMKVLESLESITGLDIPMVFSILSDAKVNGHLNLVTPDAQIFGVTFCKGKVAVFDSENADRLILEYLLDHNFLSEADWAEFQSLGVKKGVVNKLINKGYVSPHAIESARFYQIERELGDMIIVPEFQVSFVPDDSIDNDEGLDYASVHAAIRMKFSDNVDLSFYKNLYNDYMDSPVRLTESSEFDTAVWNYQEIANISMLKEKIQDGQSLTEIFSSCQQSEMELFSAIHSLMINRMILFDDLKKTKNAEANLERLKKMHRDLSAKNALEIFTYFGASKKVNPTEVSKIYKSFEQTNHPNHHKEDGKEVQDLAKKIFDIVTEAHHLLTDDALREKFFGELDEKNQTIQVEAGVLSEQGLNHLKRGQSQAAFEALSKAYELTPTSRLYFMSVWAEVKAKDAKISQERLVEIIAKLDAANVDEKRDSYYWMALGLCKKASGDPLAATYFEKALSIDNAFVEARRELSALQVQSSQGKSSSSKTMDFLKGDITELVSQIFRKKSG